MLFHTLRRAGSLTMLLALLLLFPLTAAASPAYAASHKASASPHREPDAQGISTPVRTSTTSAPHRGSGTPASQSAQSVPAVTPVVSAQPAPSSGARALTPPVRPRPTHTGVVPNTVTASPSFSGQNSALDSGHPFPNLSSDIGPDNVMDATYYSFSIYDRSGNLQYNNTLSAWFNINSNAAWGGAGNVLFDPWNERFVLVTNIGSNILISVAQQSNALGGYCNYSFGTGFTLNYTVIFQSVGLDETYLYVTLVPEANSPFTNLYQINLQQMESCSGVSSWSWSNVTDPNGQAATSLVPATIYSYNAGTEFGTEYLVDASAGGGCSVTLWRVNSHVLSNNTINTECYSPPPNAPEPGIQGNFLQTTDTLFTLTQATYLNGLLDFALTTGYNWGGGNVTSVIAWLKINPQTATVSQQGYFGNASYWYFYPAMAQDFYGKAIIVFEVSSPTLYPSVWYTGQNADGSLQDTQALAWGKNTLFAPDYIGLYQSARWDSSESDHTATQIWISGAYAVSAITIGMQIAQTAAS